MSAIPYNFQMKFCTHYWYTTVYVVLFVGLQPTLSENVTASVAVKSPVERMQSFFSCAHESRSSVSIACFCVQCLHC